MRFCRHIADESFSDRPRGGAMPKTSSAKHQLVKQTIHQRVEKLCKCAFDIVSAVTFLSRQQTFT